MDNNSNIYERLLELPLFQGMSMADLTTAVGQTPFGFHKYDAGVQIIAEGDANGFKSYNLYFTNIY